MAFVHITDISQQMLDALLPRWRQDPTMRGIMEALAEELQEVEDVITALIFDRAISSASGVLLDRYGDLVNLEREARSDDEYRLAIQAKILANQEGHLAKNVGNVAAIFFDSTTAGARYYTLPHAHFQVSVTPDSVLSAEHIAQGLKILQEMVPAGVKLAGVIETTSNPYTLDLPGFGLDLGEMSKVL